MENILLDSILFGVFFSCFFSFFSSSLNKNAPFLFTSLFSLPFGEKILKQILKAIIGFRVELAIEYKAYKNKPVTIINSGTLQFLLSFDTWVLQILNKYFVTYNLLPISYLTDTSLMLETKHIVEETAIEKRNKAYLSTIKTKVFNIIQYSGSKMFNVIQYSGSKMFNVIQSISKKLYKIYYNISAFFTGFTID